MIDTLAEAPAAGPSSRDRVRGIVLAVLRPVVVVGVALLIGMGIIIYTGQNPLPAYENLLIEPFRSDRDERLHATHIDTPPPATAEEPEASQEEREQAAMAS